MREIEVKILEINKNEIIKKLEQFASKEVESNLLTTITFSNPYGDASIRLRKTKDEVIFTVKTKVPDKEFKVREEYETKIYDLEMFKKQLEILGFKQIMLQEKRRTIYKYKNSRINIDEYPLIPPYIEIEGDKNEIEEIVNKIGYTLKDVSQMNVYKLFSKYNIDAKELRF